MSYAVTSAVLSHGVLDVSQLGGKLFA